MKKKRTKIYHLQLPIAAKNRTVMGLNLQYTLSCTKTVRWIVQPTNKGSHIWQKM